MEHDLLTRAEAAALMRLSGPAALSNMHARGEGPAYMKTARLRGKALYRREVVLAYLEGNGRKPAGQAKRPRKATSRKASHA